MTGSPGSFIVTGAGGGVGSAAVRQLAERGANVMAVDRDEAALERTLQSVTGPGDVVIRAASSRSTAITFAPRSAS